MRRFVNRLIPERGQSLVEFALVIPVFLLLLFALVDFGRGFQAWIEVTNAAREGARVGAVHGTAGEIETRARAAAASLNQSDLAIGSSGVGGTAGSSVIVTATYNFSLISPLAPMIGIVSGGAIGETFTITSSADMRIE
jgi:Flp pilus assembly protein TadG